MNKLIILRGLPGAGKTTFANYLDFIDPEAITISADDYHMVNGEYKFDINRLAAAHTWCQEYVKMHMANYAGCIVLHNTSTTERELKPYLDLAKEYNYQVISLIVENRHGNKNIHNVPEETLTKMESRFHVKLI